jgi:hypothetical protein
LFLGTPRDETITQEHSKARGGALIIWAASPIRITIGVKLQRRLGEGDAMITGMLDEAEDSLGCSPMSCSRAVEVLAELIDRVDDVRVS